jgi:hypothetical protein
MLSRPFILQKGKLSILIDSSSIDKALPNSSRRAQALLRYNDSDLLEFTRTSENVKNDCLKQIVQLQRKYAKDGSLHSIQIVRERSKSDCCFGYKPEQVSEIGKSIYNKTSLDLEELNSIELVFVHASLNGYYGLDILVTDNEVLLKNRLWFESHFPGGTLNIMTLEEARDHIHDYVHFIKSIYLLRDTVLHREGLQKSSFEQRGKDERWQANFVRVPNELAYCLKQCGDKKEDCEPWTRFGIFDFNRMTYLEPYKFVKSSALLLSNFCSKYLQLLGFSNFIEDRRTAAPEDDFIKTISIFERDNLGL